MAHYGYELGSLDERSLAYRDTGVVSVAEGALVEVDGR